MIRAILFFLLASVAVAQEETNQPPNVAVQFWGAGNTNGYPQYWPIAIESVGTNTTAPAGWYVFTPEQFDNLKATNAAAFKAAQDARHAALNAKAAANLARIVFLFQQIPTARAQMTNIQTSTISSVAAASTAIKATANVVDGILEELQRLGPVLKEIYKPDQDSTQ